MSGNGEWEIEKKETTVYKIKHEMHLNITSVLGLKNFKKQFPLEIAEGSPFLERQPV